MNREIKLNLIDKDIKLTFAEFCKKRIDILNSVYEHTINIINNHVPDYDLKLSTLCKYFFNMPYQIISKYKTYFRYLLLEKPNNTKEIPFSFNHKKNNINKSIDFFQLPKEDYTNMYNDIKYIFNVIKLRNTDIHSSTLLYIPINNNFTSSILDLDIYFDTADEHPKSLNKLIETFFKYFSKIDEIFWFISSKIKQIYDIEIEYSKKYNFLYFEYIEKSYKTEPVEINLLCSYNNNIDFNILHTDDFIHHAKFVVSINNNNNKKYNLTNLCIVSNYPNNIDIKSSICLMKKIIKINNNFINLNIFKYITSILYNNTNTNQNLFIEYIIDDNKYLLDNITINDYYAIYDINIFNDSDIKYLFQKNDNLYNIDVIIKHIIKLVKNKEIKNKDIENNEYFTILKEKILKYKNANANDNLKIVYLQLSQFNEIIENKKCVSNLLNIYKLLFVKYGVKNIIDFIGKTIEYIDYLIILFDNTFFEELIELFEITIDNNICINLINMKNETNSENINKFLKNKNIKVNITNEINISDFRMIYYYYNEIIPIPTYCNIGDLINKLKSDTIMEEFDLTGLFN